MALPHEKIRELREKQQRAVAQGREHLDAITDTATAEARAASEAAHDAALAEYDRLGALIKREEDQIERESRANPRDPRRPNGDDRSVDPANPADKAVAARAAYGAYLRFGLDNLTADERKLVGPQRQFYSDAELREARAAQGVGDATAGGYLVPQGFQDELSISLKMYGPMLDPGVTRELATTTGNLLPWPSMDDTANKGRRLSENTQVNPTVLAFGVHNLNAWKYTTDVCLVSRELLQDSAIDPEQTVRDAMAIRLGRAVNPDLTTGTGASMPTGLAFASPQGYQAASSSAIVFDDMIETEHGLDPMYRKMPGCGWMFADSTLKALRKLKNGDGDYIWQPASVIAKAPATILGYDYEINQDMAAIATGNKSVVFGDFQRYIVRRVKEFLVRRLDERYADYDQVGFIGFARYDGALVDSKGSVALVHP